jgi:glycerophosphoryl diester phosphodiesterase
VVDAPLLIAHRAGNDPAKLRAAERARADVIEADLHLRRGRLELRHLKTAGPLPVYWDRWALAPPWRRFDSVEDLLTGAGPQTALLLDLKGSDPAAARMLSAALSRAARTAPLLVSARAWPLLDEIDPALARRIGSAARPRQLAELISHAAVRPLDGAALHLRLLQRELLAPLRDHAPLLMTWPVNHRHEADRASALGVGGLISDDLGLVAALREERGLRRPAGAQRAAQRERPERDRQSDHADGQVDERDAELHADAEGDDARGRSGLV